MLVALEHGGLGSDLTEYPDFSLLVKYGDQYIPVDIDIQARIGSSNLITSDAVAIVNADLSSLAASLSALAANLLANYLTTDEVIDLLNEPVTLERGGLGTDVSGYGDFTTLVKLLDDKYTPVDIDVTPTIGSANLITSDAVASLAARLDAAGL
jgi:hypothetical protein